MASPCKPAWHDFLTSSVRPRSRSVGVLSAGCAMRYDGVLPCLPEAMRLTVESRLRVDGLLGQDGVSKLSLDQYALARCLASEAASSGNVEQKVALAEATINHRGKRWSSVAKMLMRDGLWFAQQLGSNPPAASSKDPSWEDIVIATLALDGRTYGFVRGASMYFGAGALGANLQNVYNSWTAGGASWIGRLPGISSRDQMFFAEGKPSGDAWAAARAAGQAELGLSSSASYVDPVGLPACNVPLLASKSSKIGFAVISAGVAVAGFTMLARR